MENLLQDLQVFNAYILGEPNEKLKAYLNKYTDNKLALEETYLTSKLDDERIRNEIITLLKNLNIHNDEKKRYLEKKTLFSLLEELTREKHCQISYILSLIKEKKGYKKLEILLALFISIIILIITNIIFRILNPLEHFLAAPYGLTVIGLVSNLVLNLYRIKETFTNQTISLSTRYRDAFFILSGMIAKTSAYILILFGSVSSFVVVLCFVLGELFNVLKQFAIMRDELQEIKEDNPETLAEKRAHLRKQCSFEKYKKATIINLNYAIASAAITSFWCFVSGRIIFIMGILSAMATIYFVKKIALTYNEENHMAQLQRDLIELKPNQNVSQKDINIGSEPTENNKIVTKNPFIKKHKIKKSTKMQNYYKFFQNNDYRQETKNKTPITFQLNPQPRGG